jgi:hypothetical protein
MLEQAYLKLDHAYLIFDQAYLILGCAYLLLDQAYLILLSGHLLDGGRIPCGANLGQVNVVAVGTTGASCTQAKL